MGQLYAPATPFQIGAPVAGGTPYSVIYIDALTEVAQDNANFNYQPASKSLFVQAIQIGRGTAGAGDASNTTLGFNAGGMGGTPVASGRNITAIGAGALQQVMAAGTDNLAIGTGAMLAATTTKDNIAIGAFSLSSVTAGAGQSVAIGYHALASTTSPNQSVAIGYQAMSGVANGGANNVAIGSGSLSVNTGGASFIRNTAIGTSTSTPNDTFSNTIVGYGSSIASSNWNVAIGDSASAGGGNSLAIGYQSVALNAGSVGIGNTSVEAPAANSIVIGRTSTVQTKIYGSLVSVGGLSTSIATAMVTSTVALNDGAAAALGTLTDAPIAGNPTKWVPINDNGTTRYIPAW